MSAPRNWMQAIHAHVEQICQRREAAARGESAALRDAITSMIALEDEAGALGYVATFSYGDDADEVQFTGGDALACCEAFAKWYAALPEAPLTRRAE